MDTHTHTLPKRGKCPGKKIEASAHTALSLPSFSWLVTRPEGGGGKGEGVRFFRDRRCEAGGKGKDGSLSEEEAITMVFLRRGRERASGDAGDEPSGNEAAVRDSTKDFK